MKHIKKLPPDRLAVLEKISDYERLGGDYFFRDVEDDPPSEILMPSDVDYLHSTTKFKVNGFLSRGVEWACKNICKSKFNITIHGSENLKNLTGGAIFTSNHFSVTENLAVKLAGERAPGKHRMYKLVREGNYFMPGFIGWLLKYCDTLPLSSNLLTMKMLDEAISQILKNGDFILVYPEQAMWWNYKKPRPYKIGAYYYAAKNDVPIVPCFVTLHAKDARYDMLPDNLRYEIHIMPLIYPQKDVRHHSDAQRMLEENLRLCRETYERVYGEKLEYIRP